MTVTYEFLDQRGAAAAAGVRPSRLSLAQPHGAAGGQQGGPGVIDFQDALRGPIGYDLVSLLKDCYISWSRERVERWVRGYRRVLGNLGANVGDSEYQFMRWFDLIGVQRHIKVLGIFCAAVASRRQDRLSRRPAADVRIRARRVPPLSRAGRVRALARMARRAASRSRTRAIARAKRTRAAAQAVSRPWRSASKCKRKSRSKAQEPSKAQEGVKPVRSRSKREARSKTQAARTPAKRPRAARRQP